ncbi:hypothetical protein OKW29_002855 [Paraburkholderia sp. CI3]
MAASGVLWTSVFAKPTPECQVHEANERLFMADCTHSWKPPESCR